MNYFLDNAKKKKKIYIHYTYMYEYKITCFTKQNLYIKEKLQTLLFSYKMIKICYSVLTSFTPITCNTSIGIFFGVISKPNNKKVS